MWDSVAPDSNNLGAFLSSICRKDKPLIKLAFIGDSLTARGDLGEAIPVGLDEGVNCRPPRFGTNSVPRRVYDYLMRDWNKAIFRACSHGDWSETGSWAIVNDETVYEPPHPDTSYHYSVDPLASKSFTATHENMAIITHRSEGFGVLEVTLNGGSIAAHGPETISLQRTPPVWAIADLGNPHNTTVYTGLTVGDVITVAKQNDSAKVGIQGGLSWNGTTLVPYNLGHSGHNLSMLISHGHLQADYLDNDFGAALFQLPVMNECGAKTVPQTVADMKTVISEYTGGKDVAFYTPHAFGTDGATNYYTLYSDPSMADFVKALRNVMYSAGVPYQDVFAAFKRKVEAKGGTLDGGEISPWFLATPTQDDGQHTFSDRACGAVFSALQPMLEGKLR